MPFLVIIMVWLGEHQAFVVKCFIKTESYTAVQRASRKKLKLKDMPNSVFLKSQKFCVLLCRAHSLLFYSSSNSPRCSVRIYG